MIYTAFLIIVAIIGISAAWAGVSAAPWLPTRKNERASMRERIQIKPNHIVYDLGCGTGTLLFDLAKQFPEARYIGYDISLLPLLIGNVRKLLFFRSYKNVSLRFGNLFTQSYAEADIIFAFLLDKAYEKLKKTLAKSVKDDCLIIIEAWPIKSLLPRDVVESKKALPLFIYEGTQFRKI